MIELKYHNSFISSPELKYKKELIKKYSSKSLKHQFRLKNRVYDFCINDELIVEYDGYYWHEIKNSKHQKIIDEEKNKIALDNGFSIYRIKEDKNRKTNFNEEINKIESILNEIQSKKNKMYNPKIF